MERQIEVTYVGHSGFAVETEKCCLWFDVIAQEEGDPDEKPYAQGVLPEIPKEKPLIIFASHNHHDHYCTEIWKLCEEKKDIFYVLGNDISLAPSKRRRLGIADETLEKVVRLSGGKTYDLPQFEMKIEAIKSTDAGVAFYVTVDGITIFHAGDLNAWYWLEEGEAYVSDMKKAFERQMLSLQGKKADLAFLLLDPRLGEMGYVGMDRYLETLDVRYTFPMHLWRQYGFIDEYRAAREGVSYVNSIQTIQHENERFKIIITI